MFRLFKFNSHLCLKGNSIVPVPLQTLCGRRVGKACSSFSSFSLTEASSIMFVHSFHPKLTSCYSRLQQDTYLGVIKARYYTLTFLTLPKLFLMLLTLSGSHLACSSWKGTPKVGPSGQHLIQIMSFSYTTNLIEPSVNPRNPVSA